MRVHPDFACSECDGAGKTICSECESEHECDYCNGTGLNPDKMYLAAFSVSEKRMMGAGASWSLWEKGSEGSVEIGRQGTGWCLRYADFVKAQVKP